MLTQVPILKEILQFSTQFEIDDYRVLEVEESLLEKMLSKDESVEIRGESNSDCIIVTSSEAWEMKKGEFTNTELLILPTTGRPHAPNDDIHALELDERHKSLEYDHQRIIDGAITSHCIFLKSPPKMHLLQELLKPSAFDGDDEAAGIDEDILTTWDEIQDTVQGSDAQIHKELHQIHAIKFDGYYRLLDEQYWWSCMDDILDLLLQNDLSIDTVDGSVVISSVTDFPKEVVEHLLEYFSESQQDNIFKLDETKLCLFRGVQALVQHPKVSEEEFFQHWNDMVPYPNVVPSEELLRGHALFYPPKANRPGYWERFEEGELPMKVKKRFKALFNKKQEWHEEEFKPFLSGLVRAGHDMDKLLLKNTRIITNKDPSDPSKVIKKFKPRHVSYGNRGR